jgi:hypothetical protein
LREAKRAEGNVSVRPLEEVAKDLGIEEVAKDLGI